MDQAEREKMVADAILAERAAAMLERRYPRDLMTSPVMHATHYLLRDVAIRLRDEAGSPQPGWLADPEAKHVRDPWADPGYPDVKKDIQAAFPRQSERTVIE